MAISFVSTSKTETESGSDPSGTEPSGAAEGDLLILIAHNDENNSLSLPSGWTELGSQAGPYGAFNTLSKVGYIIRGSSQPSYDLTGTINYAIIRVVAYRGVDTGTPIRNEDQADESAVSPSINANDGDLLISIYDDSNWTATDPPSGMTKRTPTVGGGDSEDATAVADLAISSTGATGTKTWTTTSTPLEPISARSIALIPIAAATAIKDVIGGIIPFAR